MPRPCIDDFGIARINRYRLDVADFTIPDWRDSFPGIAGVGRSEDPVQVGIVICAACNQKVRVGWCDRKGSDRQLFGAIEPFPILSSVGALEHSTFFVASYRVRAGIESLGIARVDDDVVDGEPALIESGLEPPPGSSAIG